MFPAFPGTDQACVADALNIVKSHIGHSRAGIQVPFFFHLQDDMLQQFLLVWIQLQPFSDPLVALDQFFRSEFRRDSCSLRVILNQVTDCVQRPVH